MCPWPWVPMPVTTLTLPARLDLHPRALVGPDAGALDVGDDADADLPAFGAQPRLARSATNSS